MKRLLVASVVAPGPRGAVWLRLQREYLSRTTGVPYDHAVWLAAGAEPETPGDLIVAGRLGGDGTYALGDVVQFCRANPYDYYLILAPDAFPCAPGWLSTLVRQMWTFPEATSAVTVLGPEYVTPQFPGAAFVVGATIHTHMPTLLTPAATRLGRTNVWSPHPVRAGVYDHLFFWHGTGVAPRSALYYEHIVPAARDAALSDELAAALAHSPQAVLDRLTGATPLEPPCAP